MQRDDGDQYDAKECFDSVFCSDHCPALQEVFQCVTLPGELRPHSHLVSYDHTVTAVLPLPNTLATCASLPQELNTTASDHTNEWHRRRSNGKYPLKSVQEMGLKQALLSRTPPQLLFCTVDSLPGALHSLGTVHTAHRAVITLERFWRPGKSGRVSQSGRVAPWHMAIDPAVTSAEAFRLWMLLRSTRLLLLTFKLVACQYFYKVPCFHF